MLRSPPNQSCRSVHGFPVGLVQCESNFLGITNGNGTNVGSGGWSNIIAKYAKAKRYCDAPFEVHRKGSRNVLVPIEGEWIGEKRNGVRRRNIAIHCTSATPSRRPSTGTRAKLGPVVADRLCSRGMVSSLRLRRASPTLRVD